MIRNIFYRVFFYFQYFLLCENNNCAPTPLYSLVTKRLLFAGGSEVEGVSGSTKEDFTLHA